MSKRKASELSEDAFGALLGSGRGQHRPVDAGILLEAERALKESPLLALVLLGDATDTKALSLRRRAVDEAARRTAKSWELDGWEFAFALGLIGGMSGWQVAEGANHRVHLSQVELWGRHNQIDEIYTRCQRTLPAPGWFWCPLGRWHGQDVGDDRFERCSECERHAGELPECQTPPGRADRLDERTLELMRSAVATALASAAGDVHGQERAVGQLTLMRLANDVASGQLGIHLAELACAQSHATVHRAMGERNCKEWSLSASELAYGLVASLPDTPRRSGKRTVRAGTEKRVRGAVRRARIV